MDKVSSRHCQNCNETGHSSMDCPRIGGAKVRTRRSSSSSNLKLWVSNDKPPPLIPIRSKSYSHRSARVRLQDNFKRSTSSIPKIRVKTKRLRDYTDSEGENLFVPAEEPLTIQVDYKPPKKSKQKLKDNPRYQRSDLRMQLKVKPEVPAPKYKTNEDLRFSIKRGISASKRKKLKPPEHLADYPESDEEELLEKGGNLEIKHSKSGTVITFESSDEDVKQLMPPLVKIKKKSSSSHTKSSSGESIPIKQEIKQEVICLEDEELLPEIEEVKTEVKEEPESVSASGSQNESSSGDEEDSSSTSSGSESEESVHEEVKKTKKKYIDIRDKYDSKPIVSSAPLSSRLGPKSQHRRNGAAKPKAAEDIRRDHPDEVKRDHPDEVKRDHPDEVKRDHPASDDSDDRKKPTKKRPKVSTHKSRVEPVPQKSRDPPTTQKSRDAPITRTKVLSTQSNDGYDSFSDDGESHRTHSGALAGDVEELPVETKRPKVEKIVPIFPFTTHCRPGSFPESKVPFLDSHCHIDYLFVRERNYGSFGSYVASKDFPKNFSGCIANFCDPPAWGEDQMYEDILEEDGVWAAFGLHPHNAALWSKEVERNLIKACSHPKCVAWGEMGLDYGTKHRDLNPDVIEMQKDAFMIQIKHALKMRKPLVIHARGAEFDAFEILKEKVPKDHRIHFHCYTGMWSIASRMIDYFPNMFIGITGLVTYSTATDVREVTRKCPLNRILVETDAPYMKPSNASNVDKDSPRTASPAMGIWVAHKIAEIRKLDLDEVLKQVRLNVRNMYGI